LLKEKRKLEELEEKFAKISEEENYLKRNEYRY
jgi:hypothetical protein